MNGHIDCIQCRSEISEPKYARKMRIIRVFVYTHTSIDAYVSLVCMSLPIVFSFVERLLLISMGIAFAVKTGGQGCTECPSIVLCLFRLFVSQFTAHAGAC